MASEILSRREILRNSAVIGGGAVVGGALTAGTAAGSNGQGGQGQGGVGYMSVSSYEKLVGDYHRDVDCVDEEEGWGDTFYIRSEGPNMEEGGDVFIEAPPSCNDNAPDQTFRGYTITAEFDTTCGGSPSGSGPMMDECCTWLFVNTNRNIRFDIEQRITNVHGPEPPAACHTDVQARYGDGTKYDNGPNAGSPLRLVRVTFAPVPEGGQGRNGRP